ALRPTAEFSGGAADTATVVLTVVPPLHLIETVYEVGDVGQTPTSLTTFLLATAVSEAGRAGDELVNVAVLPDGHAVKLIPVATPAGTLTVLGSKIWGCARAGADRPRAPSVAT